MAKTTEMFRVTLLLVIIGGGIEYASAIKLNLTEICSESKLYFCTITHINASFQDPLIVVNASQTYLDELELRNSQFGRVPFEIFSLAPKLRTIIMHNCGVKRLNVNDFSQAQQLNKLILQKNRLFDLPAKIFSSLTGLEELHLSANTLHQLYRSTFSGLRRLKYLDMQQNDIATLPPTIFDELINVEHIDLSHNEIEQINAETFAMNKRLQTILLNDNNFIIFEPNSLLHLTHLRLLDVSNNRIPNLSLQTIDTLLAQNATLQLLSINGSAIKIHANKNQLVRLFVSEKLSVREVELHNNSLETLDDFMGMLNLQRLDVSQNRLKTLSTSHSPLYLPLPNLNMLNLAWNKFHNLTVDNFIITQKITHLDLAFNDLMQLDAQIFEPLLNLEKLYIEGNLLQNFDYVTFTKQHSKLKEFGILQNEWELRVFKSMLNYCQQHNIQITRHLQHESITDISEVSELSSNVNINRVSSQISENKPATNEQSCVSGIHPYFTLRDILAVAVLVGIAIVIVLQFYMILKEEGCLPLRCPCLRGNNRNGQRNLQRLDEDDSEV